MLFNINNKTSLVLLKITGFLSFILIPTFLNVLSVDAMIYCTFTVFMIVAALRIKATSKIYFSIQHSVYALLIVFGILSFIWSKNPSHNLMYIFAIGTILAFSMVMKDYFVENSVNNFKRRMAYFMSIAGVICAGINIFYWAIYVVPVAGNEPLKKGMATENFLGIFMILCIACTACLFRKNSKCKKLLIVLSVIMMLFVFLMTKSVASWMFLTAFIVLILLKKKIKSTKNYTMFTSGVIVLYFITIILLLINSVDGKALADVFKYFLKNLSGVGGGFWSGRETFSRFDYNNSGVGLFAYSLATAGIVGFIACVLLLLRYIVIFVKLKTTESAVSILLFLTLLMLPFGWNLGTVLLLTGLNVYNEHSASADLKYVVKDNLTKKVSAGVGIAVILSSVLTVLSVMKMNAYTHFESGEYDKAYETYKTVSAINIMDSQSHRMAALSILNDKNLLIDKKDEAILFVDKAIKSDSLNLENLKIKAKIYYYCGEYELASQQYRIILNKAAVKDEYNLLLADVLYKIVEENQKGSSVNKRAYEEIVEIAQSTYDLECKEKIVDIADKAQAYTKGVLNSEREEIAE